MPWPRVDRIAIVCPTCGTKFEQRASRGRVYCSKACSGKATAIAYAARRVAGVCSLCGKPFEMPSWQAANGREFCSFACRQIGVAKRTVAARAAKMRAKPAKASTYRKLNSRHIHRTVAEHKLGRKLLPGEIVHHIDGNKHNNAPENLEILTGQNEHARLHFTKNRLCSIAGCGRKHAAKGYCERHWRQWRKGKLNP